MQYQAPAQWLSDIWSQSPFTQLRTLDFAGLNHFPSLSWLERKIGVGPVGFASQQELDSSGLYYEEFIYTHKRVPTRADNWHDLFNAAIWAQFPQSKTLLNQQHMQDIAEHGLNPRTPRRNRITQFDECGVVLAVANTDLAEKLAAHQWSKVFVEHRSAWGKEIGAFVFGHANFEMLLNPFIGLTGKWLPVVVDDCFFAQTLSEQLAVLDKALAQQINDNVFAHKGSMHPLPLLGVPGWFAENKNAGFYANPAYFMPKRVGR